jgi:hypothetical protein
MGKGEPQTIRKSGRARPFALSLGARGIRRQIKRLGRKPSFPRGRQTRGRSQERPLNAHPPAGGAAAGGRAATALFRYRVGDAVTGRDAFT